MNVYLKIHFELIHLSEIPVVTGYIKKAPKFLFGVAIEAYCNFRVPLYTDAKERFQLLHFFNRKDAP